MIIWATRNNEISNRFVKSKHYVLIREMIKQNIFTFVSVFFVQNGTEITKWLNVEKIRLPTSFHS